MLISKDDHRKFVENLHTMHKQELKKAQELTQSHLESLTQTRQQLGIALKQAEDETCKRIAVNNEL
jgi:CRISPR/Cas system CSM-associated protein Csm4 (group 5 of RAMP superfamily)